MEPEPTTTSAPPHSGDSPARMGVLFLMACALILLAAAAFFKIDARIRLYLDGATVLVLVISSAFMLARALPWQNIIAAGLVTTAWFGVGFALTKNIWFIPDTPLFDDPTSRLGDLIPWAAYFLAASGLFLARELAAVILQPWRNNASHGFWLIGVSLGLFLLYELGAGPVLHSRDYLHWRAEATGTRIFDAPWTQYAALLLMALVAQLFSTPWLIDKRPGQRPLTASPLFFWILLSALLAASHIQARQWQPLIVVGASTVALTALAIWGLKHAPGPEIVLPKPVEEEEDAYAE